MAKILITDDSDFMRELMRDIIAEQGYDVEYAASGEEMLTVYQNSRPDVVILDIVMPGLNGLETLKRLKEYDADAKVIICSAVVEQEGLKEDAIALGAVACIPKPFVAIDIINIIKSFL